MKDFPLFRSARSAVVGTLLLILPMLFLSSSPVGGLYLAALLLFAGPAALCVGGAVCGIGPMALGCAAALLCMGRVFGGGAALLTAAYLLPVIAAFLVIVLRRVPFRTGCGIMVGIHVACFAALYLLLRHWAGGDLYGAAGKAAMEALDRWEYGDTVLFQFYTAGLIGLPASLAEGALQEVAGGWFVFSDAARQDLLMSMSALVSSTLSIVVPGLIVVRQSILGGVGCLLLPLRFGYLAQRKRQYGAGPSKTSAEAAAEAAEAPAAPAAENQDLPVDFPDLGMPDFSRWYIPRGYGWQVGAALALGLILQGSATPVLAVAGIILYYAGAALFSIQGAAMLNFTQKARGTRRCWRIIVPLLLISTSLLTIVGIFDQIVNVRGLRMPPEPKEGF